MRFTRTGLISVLLAVAVSLGFATGRLTGKSRPDPMPARSPALGFARGASTPLEALLSKKIAACEAYAVAMLLEYHAVQHGFACADRYGTGRYVYANPVDGSGFTDLWSLEVDGRKLGYLVMHFALATLTQAIPVPAPVGSVTPAWPCSDARPDTLGFGMRRNAPWWADSTAPLRDGRCSSIYQRAVDAAHTGVRRRMPPWGWPG
jgi:hypothetical protein